MSIINLSSGTVNSRTQLIIKVLDYSLLPLVLLQRLFIPVVQVKSFWSTSIRSRRGTLWQNISCKEFDYTHISIKQESSGSTGPKAFYSLVLLDIYWTHKSYISVFPKINQLNFSAAPPFCPFPCNHSWTVFKLGIRNSTQLCVGGIKNYLNTCIVCHLVPNYLTIGRASCS